jgi:hypothetical protein
MVILLRQRCGCLPANSESYQARSERCEHHAKINYASAGWWPTALLCNLGVMLGTAHLRVVQAEKAEQQREDSSLHHSETNVVSVSF